MAEPPLDELVRGFDDGLLQLHEDYIDSLTDDQKQSINDQLTMQPGDINQLIDVIANAPSSDQVQYLYYASRLQPVNNQVDLPPVFSTTRDPNGVRAWLQGDRVLFKFIIPEHQPLLSVQSVSQYPAEEAVLILGGNYDVVEHSQLDDGTDLYVLYPGE
jgi:hypothetical protein